MDERLKSFDPFKGIFGNLENLADTISDTLNCPVTIEDFNHRLLAYSTHEESTDPARIATIIGRRVPEKVINNLWKDGIIPKLQQSDEPLRIPTIEKIGLGDRVAVSIRKGTEVLGYIWALEVDKKLTDNDLLLLKNAAIAAKNHLLQHHAGTKKREENNQEFFWQMLTGHIQSESEIQGKLQRLALGSIFPYTILIFHFPEEIDAKTEKNISYLTTTIQSVRTPFTANDEKIFMVLATTNNNQPMIDRVEEFIASFILQMNERFGISGIKAGYGGIYDSLIHVEKSYHEALTVLSLKEKFKDELPTIHNYRDLGLYQFLEEIYCKQLRDGYTNEKLDLIQGYDKKHHTNLYETLETFLNHDDHVQEAAKALHVHTNTLNYRLKRIAEMTGLRLRDPNQKMMLYLDIKIRKLYR
jgi:DNA-binding PucR family transcriptional regulator